MKPFIISSLIVAAVIFGFPIHAQQEQGITRAPLRAGAISELKSKLENPDLEDSERVEIEAQIAGVYASIGDYSNAIKHLEQSMELQDQPPMHHYYLLGRLYFQVEKIDEAMELLLDAEKLYPESLDIAELLASGFQRDEKWKESIKRFEKIVRINDKTKKQPLPATFYFGYGVAVERGLKDIDRSAQLFKQALESIRPPNLADPAAIEQTNLFKAEVLNYLGYMQLENDVNIDVAGELIKKAAKLNPDSGAIADSLGWFYFKKGRYMEAMTELLRAESHFDEDEMDGVILDHIAQTYQKIGNIESAIDYMKRAVDKDPENKEFKQRLKAYRSEEAEKK